MKFKPHVPLNEQGRKRTRKQDEPKAVDPYEAEIANNPEIARLKTELSTLYRRPRFRELIQVAAQLSEPKDFKDAKKTSALVGRAMALWRGCQAYLRNEIQDDIRLEMDHIAIGYMSDLSPLETALQYPEEFPINFEFALELIVGEKVRRTDRFKTFRDFARDTFRPHAEGEAALEAMVTDKIASLRKNGFEYHPFARAADLFKKWKATRASRKASMAARMRWSKK